MAGGSFMLDRLRKIVDRMRTKGIAIRRVTYYARTTGDTFSATGAGYWANREPQRRAMEDGRVVVRAVWHLYRTDDPLQTVVPTPMGKVVDDEGLTWLIPSDGHVTRGYRDPEQGKELKFDFDTVLKMADQTATA
jgi:hypothetical protein